VWRHVIGTDPSQDQCVYHEADESFYIGIGRSRTERLLYLHAGGQTARRRLSDALACLAEVPVGGSAVQLLQGGPQGFRVVPV
jgi:oligopeptidase B